MDASLSSLRRTHESSIGEDTDGLAALPQLAEAVLGFVRRQRSIFLLVTPCCVFLGLTYLLTTPALFTSHAMLLIDSSKLRILQQQEAPSADRPIDSAQIETQVEILKSENIGLSVIKSLKLAGDPEFTGGGNGLMSKISALLGTNEPVPEGSVARDALNAFLKKRFVSRVGQTYVLDIGFSSLDPYRSAQIANAIGDAYIEEQLEAKYQATRRASSWLQDRIKELRQQASDADRAVLDYKIKNNIVDVGGTSASGPRLLGEQQLEELNTQLSTARASAAEAKARLARIDEVMKRDIPDATVTDSLRSEVITKLRSSYLDISAKEAIWSARYGANHLAAINLRTQMSEIRRSILDELGRIAQSYRSDYEISKARVDGLEKSLESLVSSSQLINRDRLGLKELESNAQVYHTIYDSFLQRHMEAIQQQSFPITESRIISPAAPPTRKSSPVAVIILGAATILGLILSFAAAMLREALDQVFRTSKQVENFFGVSCLAVVPLMDPQEVAASAKHRPKDQGPLKGSERIFFPSTSGSGSSATQNTRFISAKLPMTRQVILDPLSSFSEAFRSIKVAADLNGAIRENKVLGITSTLPGEGKSTVSSNFAQMVAHTGKKVILIDGDLRNPTVTRSLAPGATKGLLEILDGSSRLSEVVYEDESTGLRFIPAVVPMRLPHSNEVLASERFHQLTDELRKSYDYIIIDFPPIAPVVDVRASAQVVDSLLFVVEWGSTKKNLIKHELGSAPELFDKLLGVVLNKANVKVLQRYEANYGKQYYQQYYGRYGSNAR